MIIHVIISDIIRAANFKADMAQCGFELIEIMLSTGHI